MRYIAVLLTAILSLTCAANAGGIWGEPADIAPTGWSNDTIYGQANVTRPQAKVTRPPTVPSSTPAADSGPIAQRRPPAPANEPLTVRTSDATDAAYKIGPLDVLDISVFQVPELTKSVQVADTGTVNLPLVGEIAVSGKSAQQVERDLTARLGAKYVKNPQVTVYVKEYNSQRVTVTGAVKNPGVYPIKGKTSLLQVVALAGGLQSEVSDSTVLVLRNSNGKRSAAKFDVGSIQKGEADDPGLQPGDELVAGSSAMKRGFNTILKALPLAGVFTFL